jgi:hypothetical protein
VGGALAVLPDYKVHPVEGRKVGVEDILVEEVGAKTVHPLSFEFVEDGIKRHPVAHCLTELGYKETLVLLVEDHLPDVGDESAAIRMVLQERQGCWTHGQVVCGVREARAIAGILAEHKVVKVGLIGELQATVRLDPHMSFGAQKLVALVHG